VEGEPLPNNFVACHAPLRSGARAPDTYNQGRGSKASLSNVAYCQWSPAGLCEEQRKGWEREAAAVSLFELHCGPPPSLTGKQRGAAWTGRRALRDGCGALAQ